MGFDGIRKEYAAAMEAYLHAFLAERGDALCAKMSSYHFETGGKRLRALIPLLVYQVYGQDPRAALPLGAAVEMIHNATLVHDDLQDGDEMRRGRPTIWKKNGAAQAVNCGDAMFQYAFRLFCRLEMPGDRLIRLMDRAAASTLCVIEGQAQEFEMKEEANPGVERYLGVIRGKTSGLFTLPVVGALHALGMEESVCGLAEKAAEDLGMLFQIQDDILDIYGAKGRAKAASDIAEGKISIFVAHVNEAGSPADREALKAVLRKPRSETSSEDIAEALAIFERTQAKQRAIGIVRQIQESLKTDDRLKSSGEIYGVLNELGRLFLEPLNGIV